MKYLWLPVVTIIILLFVFSYYLPGYLAIKPLRIRTVDVILFTGRLKEYFQKAHPISYEKMRRYQEIHLTGNKSTDSIKFEFARLRIREIVQQQDTIYGIHFSFSDNTRYSEFIRALDLLRIERSECYIVDKGEIWMMYFPLNY